MNLISEAILNNWGKESFQVVHFRRVSLVGIFRDPANSSVNLPHILHFFKKLDHNEKETEEGDCSSFAIVACAVT